MCFFYFIFFSLDNAPRRHILKACGNTCLKKYYIKKQQMVVAPCKKNVREVIKGTHLQRLDKVTSHYHNSENGFTFQKNVQVLCLSRYLGGMFTFWLLYSQPNLFFFFLFPIASVDRAFLYTLLGGHWVSFLSM